MIASVEHNLHDLAETPIEFIPSGDFTKSNAKKQILADAPPSLPERDIRPGQSEFGIYFGTACRLPLLTRDEEIYYFRRMNFLKWRAETQRHALNKSRPSQKKLRQISTDLELATHDLQFIAEHNLRLVVPLAMKAEANGLPVWEAISEGNTALLRAIRKFDYSRGFRFSTYATWAITRSLSRCAQANHRDRNRFTPTEPTALTQYPEDIESQTAEETRHRTPLAAVKHLLASLDKRSQTVLSLRYGLNADKNPMTLKDVGERFGVSKERIRQIEMAAIKVLESQAQKNGVGDSFML
jgi:RNA polymerase primary sigma factor